MNEGLEQTLKLFNNRYHDAHQLRTIHTDFIKNNPKLKNVFDGTFGEYHTYQDKDTGLWTVSRDLKNPDLIYDKHPTVGVLSNGVHTFNTGENMETMFNLGGGRLYVDLFEEGKDQHVLDPLEEGQDFLALPKTRMKLNAQSPGVFYICLYNFN
jgi:hypothetical protein